MKIRNGFVSNSSSSSFIIIGVTKQDLIDKIYKKENDMSDEEYRKFLDSDDNYCGFGLDFFGELCVASSEGISDAWVLGFNAEKRLITKNVNEIKEDFKKYAKEKYNMDIDLKDIHFEYGEVSSG